MKYSAETSNTRSRYVSSWQSLYAFRPILMTTDATFVDDVAHVFPTATEFNEYPCDGYPFIACSPLFSFDDIRPIGERVGLGFGLSTPQKTELEDIVNFALNAQETFWLTFSRSSSDPCYIQSLEISETNVEINIQNDKLATEPLLTKSRRSELETWIGELGLQDLVRLSDSGVDFLPSDLPGKATVKAPLGERWAHSGVIFDVRTKFDSGAVLPNREQILRGVMERLACFDRMTCGMSRSREDYDTTFEALNQAWPYGWDIDILNEDDSAVYANRSTPFQRPDYATAGRPIRFPVLTWSNADGSHQLHVSMVHTDKESFPELIIVGTEQQAQKTLKKIGGDFERWDGPLSLRWT